MKLSTVAVLLVSLAGLTACEPERDPSTTTPAAPESRPAAGADESSDTGATPPQTVALVVKTRTNPFFEAMERGAREAADARSLEFVIKAATRESAAEQQRVIVDQLIDDDVAAIVIAPLDTAALLPALAHAQRAGIVLINVDDRLDAALLHDAGVAPIPFVGVDNVEGAYRGATYLAANHPSRRRRARTKAAIIEGIPATANSRQRKRGAERAFAEHRHIELVAIEIGNWRIDDGHAATQRLLRAHADLGIIYCANDMMALGAVRALAEAGNDKVLVGGYDGIDEARAAVRAGTLAVTVDQQAAIQGRRGVELAAAALADAAVPSETFVEVALITATSSP
ncbi:substrate-binding domain-containing protein [Haliangium sp.]|uniref:substrate-binding domain-containing protein n=1 Tax=Haliangium sp. TaxID=2663208 RepID=UPI003D0FD877